MHNMSKARILTMTVAKVLLMLPELFYGSDVAAPDSPFDGVLRRCALND